MTPELANRLYNWKFAQAKGLADTEDLSAEDRELIDALAAMLGDCGWLGGQIGTVVGAALLSMASYRDLLAAEV